MLQLDHVAMGKLYGIVVHDTDIAHAISKFKATHSPQMGRYCTRFCSICPCDVFSALHSDGDAYFCK